MYVGKRDFVDRVTEVDPIGMFYRSINAIVTFIVHVDGVVLIDPDYFQKESKKDRKGKT